MRTIIAALLLVVTAFPVYAKYDCGRVQRSHFGLDSRFNLAKNWARLLPHTSAHIGAVVVQARRGRDSAGNPGGHVSRIVSMNGQCSATVSDEKGTYERDICKGLIAYVDPNGNGVMRADNQTRSFHAKRNRRHARVEEPFIPPDRLTIH